MSDLRLPVKIRNENEIQERKKSLFTFSLVPEQLIIQILLLHRHYFSEQNQPVILNRI